MRVLFVNAPMITTDQPAYGYLSPPIGIMSLVAHLRVHGVDASVVDLCTLPSDELEKRVEELEPDLVGFSCMTANAPLAHDLARRVKATRDVPVVFGGAHPSILPARVMEHPEVDYLVMGEGEIPLLELVRALEAGESSRGIPGLGFRYDGRAVFNRRPPPIPSLDSLPFPAFDVIDNDEYIEYGTRYQGYRHLVLIVTRGCSGRCTFCAQRLTMGSRFRAFPPGRLVDELEILMERYDLEGFWFKDSTLTIDRAWTMEFCDLVVQRGLKMKWACFSRIDGVDEGLVDNMRRAGLMKIWLGAESGSDHILQNLLKKDITVDMTRRAFAVCREAGVEAGGFFMFGLPGESKDDMRRTFELARDVRARPLHLAIYHPLPGTELYELYGGEEVIRNAGPEEMAFERACAGTGPVPKEEVQRIYDEVVGYFFRDGPEPRF